MTSTWLRWEQAQLSDAAFQGIEFVKLEPTGSQSARLRLKLWQRAVGLSARSFEVDGGHRNRRLDWSVESLGSDSHEVVLLLSGPRDDQPYRVRLLEGGELALHPFFAEAEFHFALDADRGDVRPAPLVEETLRAKRPAVDLLTKDYNGVVALLADRIRVLNPHWADLSPASLERVLLELLAHHADLLSYYQDRVAAEAFLELATQRHSLRQHGLLLDYTLFEGSAAEALMAFEVERDGTLPAGLAIRTQGESAEAPVVFHLPESARVLARHGRLKVAAWPGAVEAELPEGATEVLLWGRIEGLRSGQTLAFVQGGAVQVVHVVSSRPLRLQGWQEAPLPVGSPPEWREVTAVTFHPPLPSALRPFAGDFTLYGNLAVARHGELRVAWYRPALGRSIPRDHYLLSEDRQRAVQAMGETGRRLLRAVRLPGPVLFTTQKGQPVPLLEVRVGGRPWVRVEHLHRSQSFHPHYVASADEDGSVWLQFGDGLQGLAVEDASADVEARYYVGDPIAGNCAPNRLTALVLPEDGASREQLAALGRIALRNVTAGTGGRQPETKDAARLGIAASVRYGARERAVSLEDCAELARSVPGVARVGVRLLGGAFNTVQVLVDPEGRVGLTAELQATVRERLEEARLAGRELRVEGPRYVPLELALVVAPLTGFSPHQVREAVLTALRPGTSARPGFFHPDLLGFGEAVEAGRLIAHVHRVPGVRAVTIQTLRRFSQPPSPVVPQRLLLEPEEIALLDGEPTAPENGTLVVRVVGLDARDEELLS